MSSAAPKMQKSDYLRQRKLNPSDELRELLYALETRLPLLKSMTPTQARILLRDMDQVDTLFARLEAGGVDLLPEQSRFNAVKNQLKNNAGQFLKAVGGARALQEHRPTPPPPRERWWWYIQEVVADQKRKMLRRVGITVLVVLAIVGAVIVAFNTIFAPSPEAVARVEAENQSLSAFETGDYQQALAAVEQGLAVVPDDPTLLIIKGVLHEALNQESQAAQSFKLAQNRVAGPTDFYLGRGQLYYRIGQFEKAQTDAQTAIELSQNLSAAWLLLGRALEAQGQEVEAISAYQQASDIAMENGDSEVVVLSRLALSRLGFAP